MATAIALRADRIGRRLRRRQVHVGDGDLGAFPRVDGGDFLADAAGGAGDDGDLALKLVAHDVGCALEAGGRGDGWWKLRRRGGEVEHVHAFVAAIAAEPARILERRLGVGEAGRPVLEHRGARELVVLRLALVVLAAVDEVDDVDRRLATAERGEHLRVGIVAQARRQAGDEPARRLQRRLAAQLVGRCSVASGSSSGCPSRARSLRPGSPASRRARRTGRPGTPAAAGCRARRARTAAACWRRCRRPSSTRRRSRPAESPAAARRWP